MAEAAFPDKSSVRRSFGKAAEAYDRNAILQAEVARRLLDHLDPIRIEPRRIVDLGCGTGALAAPLRERFARAELVGVDIALPMLGVARSRSKWWQRVAGRAPRWVCADAERLPLAAASAQLLVSNLSLQWCRPEVAFPEAHRVLETGGLYLFSTFGPDTLKELRAAWAAVDADPHVNTFIDMHDLGDWLVQAGFSDPVMEMEVITLEYATTEAVARDLKAIGARNALPGRARGLAGRDKWRRLAAAYEPARRNGALPATYEVIYGHAWKPPPRMAPGHQVIDFQGRGKR